MNVQNTPLPTEREYSMRKHAERESVELCNVKLLQCKVFSEEKQAITL